MAALADIPCSHLFGFLRINHRGILGTSYTMTVQELIEKLKALPLGKSVLCQVVGKDGGAWNMAFDVNDVSGAWMVQLRVFHEQLDKLPEWPPSEPNSVINNKTPH
jgi:hypothetical protein